jgi:hypothetical protein
MNIASIFMNVDLLYLYIVTFCRLFVEEFIGGEIPIKEKDYIIFNI